MPRVLYVDGSHNHQRDRGRVAVYDAQAGRIVCDEQLLPCASNNVAEYEAILAALRYVQALPDRRVEVRCDSANTVHQLTFGHPVREDACKALHTDAVVLLRAVDGRVVYVDRRKNPAGTYLASTGTWKGKASARMKEEWRPKIGT